MEGFAETSLSLIATAGLLPVRRVTSFVQSGNNVMEPFDPRRRPLAHRQHNNNTTHLVHTYTDIDREKITFLFLCLVKPEAEIIQDFLASSLDFNVVNNRDRNYNQRSRLKSTMS